ncbi:hypothetical protein [Aquabacter spiritensis]|uniref:Glycosyl transferase family 25 n=1 Tax=Aquabacter spiritensis TaxID=933073 RepID=A0A4R3LTK7_9HYPH|nr:hypothetical protein [Aquabacter spiritensis]TCT01667.1 hypothetical protein EDC64_11718 [Aquabacter spiritensis]
MSIDDLVETVVLSLPEAQARQAHIADHFAAVGIRSYRFHEATPAASPLVAAHYRLGKVAGFPPCFRCGRTSCQCANNILVPAQVANFLSFMQLWRSLPRDPQKLFLICEDDVLFFPGAVDRLAEFLTAFAVPQQPLLLRLSKAGAPTDARVDGPLSTSAQRRMSNPAYIVNGAMAARLAHQSDSVTTTSDIWLHVIQAADPAVQARTLEPCLATELSNNKEWARFESSIHPKGINPEDQARKARHICRVDTPVEYDRLRNHWEGAAGPEAVELSRVPAVPDALHAGGGAVEKIKENS